MGRRLHTPPFVFLKLVEKTNDRIQKPVVIIREHDAEAEKFAS